MPGDYSRKTFKREKHYSGVLKQQGRVELDADDNEQLAIQHYRDETEAIDVIGQSGVPKKSDGFKIGIAPGDRDLTISAGRYYVEGLLCELDIAATYSEQPYFPKPDFTQPGGSPPISPPGQQISLPRDGTYLVFLDAWKREITALDDEAIREVALGGPDTATRLQNVWQVRLLEVGQTSSPSSPPSSPPLTINCQSPMPEFEQYRLASSGKLNARAEPPQPEESACLLPPGTGYNRLENQLYRVEVQIGGSLTQTRFKWSRDNASVETTITNISGSVLTVADTGKDEFLSFAPGQWVEIVDEESTLKVAPRPLVQIDKIGPGPDEITLKTSAAAFANRDGLKLRRWDQTGAVATADGLSADLAPWIELEGGIQVSFAAGDYHAGDYWLIPARAATGRIEWPVHPINGPIPQSPQGIRHHYCRLALIQSSGGRLGLLADCRKPFPALTEICADDVCFDNTTCDLVGAKTVQDALDMLCRRDGGGQCTFVIAPGQDVQAVFDAIPPNGDAEVCFQAGEYRLSQGVRVEGKGSLKISGAGFATHLVSSNAAAALAFHNCKSVLIRDIFAESRIASTGEGLNGTLTFLECDLVNVESVILKCAAAPSRAATCITVRNPEFGVLGPISARGSARIQHCVMALGDQQVGILLVNVSRSQVEDNEIRVVESSRLTPNRLLEDRQHRASLRRLLIADARLGSIRGRRDKSNVSLSSSGHTIQFRTAKSLKQAWAALLEKNPAPNIDSPRALLAHVVKLANRLLLNEEFRKQFNPFKNFLDGIFQQEEAVGSQGIVVAGDMAAEVRITNNTIEGVLQGIHVGLSERLVGTIRKAQAVMITGNTIFILLNSVATNSVRHAIFVANFESLLIENNHALLMRLPVAEFLDIDGIRIWGNFGERASVTQNYLASADGNRDQSFTTGINLEPLESPPNFIYRVNFNFAPCRKETVHAPTTVVVADNIP